MQAPGRRGRIPPGRRLHVLRLCSVFEPEAGCLDGVRAASFDPIGGMQNHTATLSRCLDMLGITQTVLTSRLAGRAGVRPLGRHGVVRRVGIRSRRMRQFWGLGALPHALARRQRVDVVHAHQGEDIATLVVGMAAAAVHRCPLVVTLHTSVRHTLGGRSVRVRLLRMVGGMVEGIALGRAAAVLVLVPRTARLLVEAGVPKQRVHVVPSGVDPELFHRTGGEDVLPDVPRPRVGFVGRLAEQKQPQLLVEAFAAVTQRAHLVIVGDGPLRKVVADAVHRSPARDRITVTGFVPHESVPAVLASLDVFVLPSLYEEMGSVLVEALASGLPVVATRTGGIPDVIEDGVTGLLVPPQDPAALASAIDELLGDDRKRLRMGGAARQHAAQYSWPSLAERVAALYGQLR